MTISEIVSIISDPFQMIEDGHVYILLIPVYVFLLSGERIWHEITRKERWDNLDSVSNIAITITVLIMETLLGFLLPLAIFFVLYEFRVATLPMVWWGWLIAFLIYDLIWYVDHHISHRTGLFWAFHSVHHSSQEYNMTVASRGFLLDNLYITRPLFYILPLLGVAPIQYIVVRLITNIWGIAQHTRMIGKLGILDRFLATPSNHRVHHGADPKYLDSNYGEVLMIWDRIFGSYTAEEEEPTYGLTTN